MEISEDVFLLPKEVSQAIKGGLPPPTPTPARPMPPIAGKLEVPTAEALLLPTVEKLIWEGTVPAQKWMTFYTKVLSRFPMGEELKLKVRVEVQPKDGLPKQKVDETKTALRELGLSEEVRTEEKSEKRVKTNTPFKGDLVT